LEFAQLRQIIEYDIRIIGMARQEILVVRLGGIKRLEGNDLGYDRSGENSGFVQLIDVGQRATTAWTWEASQGFCAGEGPASPLTLS